MRSVFGPYLALAPLGPLALLLCCGTGDRAVQAGPKAESYWQVDDVRTGMKGSGRTVMKGTKIETFQAEVLGILKNTSPGRDLILFGGGLFLIVESPMEIRDVLKGKEANRKPGVLRGFWLIILQIGVIDIVFSLDSVFTAVGLSKHIEVMIAAIVASVAVMMMVSGTVSRFIERYPTIKVLALASLVLVGIALVAQSLDLEIPNGYLYFAMAFSAAVECINLRLRERGKP